MLGRSSDCNPLTTSDIRVLEIAMSELRSMLVTGHHYASSEVVRFDTGSRQLKLLAFGLVGTPGVVLLTPRECNCFGVLWHGSLSSIRHPLAIDINSNWGEFCPNIGNLHLRPKIICQGDIGTPVGG